MAVATMAFPTDIGEVKMDNDQHDSKPALTPPTSESTGKKDDYDDDSGSELSDLEPEESIEEPAPSEKIDEGDDDAEIFPDHYYENGNVPVFKPVSIKLAPLMSPGQREELLADVCPDYEPIPKLQRIHQKD